MNINYLRIYIEIIIIIIITCILIYLRKKTYNQKKIIHNKKTNIYKDDNNNTEIINPSPKMNTQSNNQNNQAYTKNNRKKETIIIKIIPRTQTYITIIMNFISNIPGKKHVTIYDQITASKLKIPQQHISTISKFININNSNTYILILNHNQVLQLKNIILQLPNSCMVIDIKD